MYDLFDHPSSSTLFKTMGICVIILIILWMIGSINSSYIYNNGVCRECGGAYEFQNVIGRYTETYYVYKCDQCDNIIESSNYYRKVKEKE